MVGLKVVAVNQAMVEDMLACFVCLCTVGLSSMLVSCGRAGAVVHGTWPPLVYGLNPYMYFCQGWLPI
jgi:hypothetical protein